MLLIFTLARRWIPANGNRLARRPSVARAHMELAWRPVAPEAGPASILVTRGPNVPAGLKKVIAINCAIFTRRSYVPVGEAAEEMEAEQ